MLFVLTHRYREEHGHAICFGKKNASSFPSCKTQIYSMLRKTSSSLRHLHWHSVWRTKFTLEQSVTARMRLHKIWRLNLVPKNFPQLTSCTKQTQQTTRTNTVQNTRTLHPAHGVSTLGHLSPRNMPCTYMLNHAHETCVATCPLNARVHNDLHVARRAHRVTIFSSQLHPCPQRWSAATTRHTTNVCLGTTPGRGGRQAAHAHPTAQDRRIAQRC